MNEHIIAQRLRDRIRTFEFNQGIDIIDYSLIESNEDIIAVVQELKSSVEHLYNDLVEISAEEVEEQ